MWLGVGEGFPISQNKGITEGALADRAPSVLSSIKDLLAHMFFLDSFTGVLVYTDTIAPYLVALK